jgi:cell division protein FtsW
MAKKLAFDKVLFTTVVLLMFFGLVMVYSASAALSHNQGLGHFLVKQSLAAGLGLLLMGCLMHLDYRRLREPVVIYTLMGLCLVLLVGVLFSPQLNATRRWFFLAGISVQPSELAKLALIPFLAYQIEKKEEQVNKLSFLIPAGFFTAVTASLILLEPDMGTAVLLCATFFLMIFLAGLSWRYILAALAVVPPLLGAGGVFGLGPGKSMQKLFFLPHPESDFIFSIVAEELGMIGALAVVIAFAIIAWRGLAAGAKAPDAFGRYLAWGLTGVLVIQALLNVSVTVALLPTKGIPLPFISYGGSSLVVTLCICGVLLNLSQHA